MRQLRRRWDLGKRRPPHPPTGHEGIGDDAQIWARQVGLVNDRGMRRALHMQDHHVPAGSFTLKDPFAPSGAAQANQSGLRPNGPTWRVLRGKSERSGNKVSQSCIRLADTGAHPADVDGKVSRSCGDTAGRPTAPGGFACLVRCCPAARPVGSSGRDVYLYPQSAVWPGVAVMVASCASAMTRTIDRPRPWLSL